MLISVLIMAAFTVAAGILLFTTPVDADSSTPPENEPGISMPGEEGNESMEGRHPVVPTTEPPPTTTEPPPPPVVTDIFIVYDGRVLTDFTQPRGVPIELRARIEPVGIDAEIIWSSSNPEVFEVVPVDVGGVGVRVTGIARGDEKLILSVGDLQTECWVRIR
jgi:hypothetical protein